MGGEDEGEGRKGSSSPSPPPSPVKGEGAIYGLITFKLFGKKDIDES